ncbi:MAG: hypothetical protein GY851_10110, partial [bacterium]|nr:hypothetical protein [bacterium]
MQKSRVHRVSFAIALVAITLGCLSAPVAFAGKNDIPDPATLPWSLRDHYTFGVEEADFTYGADNTEWSIDAKGVGLVIEKARAAVTLGDGTVIDVPTHPREEATREEVTRSIGEGNRFGVLFKPVNGLIIHHSVTVPDSYPFFIIEVTVKNASDAAIDIAEISPVVLGPGALRSPKGELEGVVRRIGVRGHRPVFGPKVSPMVALFRDKAAGLTLAFWALPGGVARTGISLEPFNNAWQGPITSTYDPPIQLKPGESMKADPVFVSFAVPTPSEVDVYQSWTHSEQPRSEEATTYPECWVSVDDDASGEALTQAAQKWRGLGVRHALVPGGWEGRPGTLQGARPAYPKDMGRVAAALAAAETAPGLTVDPLATVEGKDAWTVVSADGQRWLNPANPDAFAFAVGQMKKCVAWGYRFFVVQPSII